MQSYNRIAKVKFALLALGSLLNFLVPMAGQPLCGVSALVLPLLFGALAIPLILKFGQKVFHLELRKPTWNDNPLRLKYPLVLFHFAAYFFLTIGISLVLGTAVKFNAINSLGFVTVSFGSGIFIGNWLVIKW